MVAGPGFVKLVKLTGSNNGVPYLQVAIYPGPFDIHTNEALVQHTVNEVVPQIVKALTSRIEDGVSSSPNSKEKLSPEKRVVVTGTLEEVNRYFSDNGWSDGMAIVPPTIERIKEFLRYTDYGQHEQIAVLPGANLGATPWNIAANAVMAGARPEHMPILIAMVQAIGDPKYAVSYSRRVTSTHSFQTYFWLNGPVARQLGIDFGQGLIAHPVNKVIGRTMSLIERNLIGAQIKLTQMGTYGKTTSWVLAEDDESTLQIGWKPYHVEKGFDLNASTVTTGESTVWGQNLIPATSDPKILMQLMAYDLTHKEQFAAGWNGSSRVFLVTPTTAKVLADGGYTKESLKADLANTARIVSYEWASRRSTDRSERSIRPLKRSWRTRWQSQERRRVSSRLGSLGSQVGKRSRRTRLLDRITLRSWCWEIRAETRSKLWRPVVTARRRFGCPKTGMNWRRRRVTGLCESSYCQLSDARGESISVPVPSRRSTRCIRWER